MGVEMDCTRRDQLPMNEVDCTKDSMTPPSSWTSRRVRRSRSDNPVSSVGVQEEVLHEQKPLKQVATACANGLLPRNRSTMWNLHAHQPALPQRVESVLDELTDNQRQEIMDRAEQILRDKLHVGVQLGVICTICLVDDVDTELDPCGHRVHAKCIKRWIQRGAGCPVCREELVGIKESFTMPQTPHLALVPKDIAPERYSDPDLTSPEEGFEWGWFEDVDDDTENQGSDDFNSLLYSRNSRFDASRCSKGHQLSPVVNREISTTFAVCRTFAPLRHEYDVLYSESKYPWMRALASNRHIPAKIQIRSFRIVENERTKVRHAEYLIELELDGQYHSRWRRYSAIYRFASLLGSHQFRRTHSAWNRLDATSRWFNRLELGYLHKRCKLLEEFAHALLLECTTAHPLADLLEC